MNLTKQQFKEGIHKASEVMRRHKLIEPPFLPIEVDEGRAAAQRKRTDDRKPRYQFW
jgi:hypothetical protein